MVLNKRKLISENSVEYLVKFKDLSIEASEWMDQKEINNKALIAEYNTRAQKAANLGVQDIPKRA